jgi:hypothetical protein
MRRGYCLILALAFGSVFMGCGSGQSDTGNEKLTEPSYTVNTLETQDDSLDIIDGWVREKSNIEDEDYIFFPYVKDKIKGVSYIEDAFDVNFSVAVFKKINLPSGCNSIRHAAEGCESQNNVQPDLEGSSGNKSLNESVVVKEGEILSSNESRGLDTAVKMNVQTQDVQAVSCALYEDFFDEIPQLTIKLYGISDSLWQDTFGSDMTFSFNRHTEFISQCKNNGFSDLTLLAEKNIDSTGVYYIDYKDLHAKGDFTQILMVFEFDKTLPYTYRICADGIYEISDETAYNEWKTENIQNYIQ